MVLPFRKYDQLKTQHFIQDKNLAIYVGYTKFDAVYKKLESGKYVPVYDDLPAAKTDCQTLEACLQKYQIYEEEDIYRLDDNPPLKDLRGAQMKIFRRIGDNPDQQFCCIFLFAGHGILRQGMQTIMVNEFE